MITQSDLRKAIEECLAAPNPNANTCIKLAAFYILADHVVSDESISGGGVILNSDSEFIRATEGKSPEMVLQVMDELMRTLQAVNPMLYDKTLKKLSRE